MVPLNLICLHCFKNKFEHLFNLYRHMSHKVVLIVSNMCLQVKLFCMQSCVILKLMIKTEEMYKSSS